ncbi:MAG: SAVED domain-containing protein [Hyphomonas sp.]|uniref:SAVED domain-containing protein n=1 Tax=Hyphomonas sp. TaxID=87 RepID=UPI001803D340|nr:SAVED domain-containing protein [Hyphomonas sp.]MBA3068114.1 SAVED domain-containing protein [Hyphomonas sp.]MBU3922437.1 SAVED domain-containing protein [Alphaproteobacteria bacterium]MBU4061460.1 SAVED domain-containing protein [Alphaproteobacteria bacterium]MBU4165028.1 SAVED domain-containing protein [Alphaproteobacteria bacterium]
MSLKELVLKFFATAIEWVFRRKSRGLATLKVGVTLLITVIAGLTLSISVPTPSGQFTLGWGNSGVDPALSLALVGVALAIVCVGIVLLLKEVAGEERKRVFVVELQGLRDWNGPPLVDHIPSSLVGRRDQIPVDMRQRVQDGVIVDPTVALSKITSLRNDLATREAGMDRRDFSYVVGGLAPVPLTFLTGILLDDETPITFMDWDRHARAWDSLNNPDDGTRFSVEGLSALNAPLEEVVLAVSASYAVDIANAQALFPNLPLVQLRMEGATATSHFSVPKQIALGKQFFDTCLKLHSQGATKLHLFLAAPSSLTLRFGTLYDKRNLPPVVVYQYEQGKSQPFRWAVEMPVAGVPHARILSF